MDFLRGEYGVILTRQTNIAIFETMNELQASEYRKLYTFSFYIAK